MAFPIAAIGTLVSGILGAGAAGQANALQGASIVETRRSNRAAEKMAKSSRKDALGNVLRYVEGQGWITDVTPIVQAILDAQSTEQLATLREDAPRAREASERKDARSRTADAEYQRLMQQRSNRNEKTEAEYQADELIAAAQGSRGGPSAAMMMQAIRSGDNNALQQVSAASREASPSVSQRYNTAKKAGTQQFVAEKGARDQTFFNELGQLGQAAGTTDGAQPYMADINGQMAGQQEGALNTLISTIQNGGQQLSGALRSAGANWRTPDVSGIFTGLDGIVNGPKQAQAEAQKEALARALIEAQIDNQRAQTTKLRSSF